MPYSNREKLGLINNINEALRKHKRSIYGESKYTLNPANINPTVYATIKYLSKRYDVIIGGSTVLKFYNLLDRNTNDIDIIISKKTFDIISSEQKVIKNKNSSVYNSKKIVINGISCDIIVDSGYDHKDYTEMYDMKLDNLKSIIRAKLNYGREKDFQDFEHIIKCINPEFELPKNKSIYEGYRTLSYNVFDMDTIAR